MKDVKVPNGQPWVVGTIKAGAPVPAADFALDFTLTVGSEGCYVVDCAVEAEATTVFAPLDGPEIPVVVHARVLEDAAPTIAPLCLTKGAHAFHVAPTAPAPAGGPPAPPAPVGARTLGVSGSWPNWSGQATSFTFTITVYRIGRCDGAQCPVVARADLAKTTRYLSFEGPRAPDPEGGTRVRPVERTLALVSWPPPRMALPAGEASAGVLAVGDGARSGRRRREPAGPRLTRSAPVRARGKDGVYTLCYARDTLTFGEPAILVEWLPAHAKDAGRSFSFAVAPRWPSLRAAARSLVRLDRALAAKAASTAAFHAQGFVLDGFLRVEVGGVARYAPFIDGRPVYAFLSRGELRSLVLPGLLGSWFGDGEGEEEESDDDDDGTTVREMDVTIWVKTRIEGGFVHGLGETLAHLWAHGLLQPITGPDGISGGIDNVVAMLASIGPRRCIKLLRIMSHGGKQWSPGGAVTGSTIYVGPDEVIHADDFDDDGNPLGTPGGQKLKKLLDAIKAAMCPGGRLVFSACNQGVGGLLQHISQYIDKGVSVEGHSDLGIPWWPGDMTYVDGVMK